MPRECACHMLIQYSGSDWLSVTVMESAKVKDKVKDGVAEAEQRGKETPSMTVVEGGMRCCLIACACTCDARLGFSVIPSPTVKR
jgi:hypothetical protein